LPIIFLVQIIYRIVSPVSICNRSEAMRANSGKITIS